MQFNSFWKRILILNVGILIVLFRVFTVLEAYFKKHSFNNSLFPILTDDGYPFFNSINCDIKKLTTISKIIINDEENKINFDIPNNLLKSKKCFFINKNILCKNNKECLAKINTIDQDPYYNEVINDSFIEKNYHSKINSNKIDDILSISSLINIMNNKNEFIDDKNNEIEILFYNKIVSGYYSFLFVKQYENNIKNNIHSGENDFTNYNILRQVTQFENRLNDLFYLHSLLLFSFFKFHKNKAENLTDVDNIYSFIDFPNECISMNDEKFDLTKNKIIPNNKKIFEEILMHKIDNLFDCINDINEKYSFNIDLTAINAMIKLLSEDKSISDYEYNSISILLKELSKMINIIFTAEIQLNNAIGVLRQNYFYIIIIYICSCIAIIFLINKYFMKNKNKYENDKKRKEILTKQKYGIFGQNHIKKKEINKFENNNSDKKLSNEELEYVQKLANENKADFLISK